MNVMKKKLLFEKPRQNGYVHDVFIHVLFADTIYVSVNGYINIHEDEGSEGRLECNNSS